MKGGKQERQITISKQTSFITCDWKKLKWKEQATEASWSYVSIAKYRAAEWT